MCHLPANAVIAFPPVGAQALGTILDAIVCIGELTAAFVTQGVEGAVTEQAAESFRVCIFVTGEIFTFLVLEKIIVGHCVHSPLLL